MAVQVQCITQILVNRKLNFPTSTGLFWVLRCYLSVSSQTKEVKIAERCADHLPVKGSQNKPYAFLWCPLSPVFHFGCFSSHLTVDSGKHSTSLLMFLWKGHDFWLFPVGEKASDLLVHFTPHMLFTVGRGMNNTGENHSVVPLMVLSLVSAVSCPPLFMVLKYLLVDSIQSHVLSCWQKQAEVL